MCSYSVLLYFVHKTITNYSNQLRSSNHLTRLYVFLYFNSHMVVPFFITFLSGTNFYCVLFLLRNVRIMYTCHSCERWIRRTQDTRHHDICVHGITPTYYHWSAIHTSSTSPFNDWEEGRDGLTTVSDPYPEGRLKVVWRSWVPILLWTFCFKIISVLQTQ